MELRNDILHNIPKNYWIWSYAGATYSRTKYILYSQNSNFSEEMLTKHHHYLRKINKFCMSISYKGLNLIFSSSPSFICII